jgi:hypothetical protein
MKINKLFLVLPLLLAIAVAIGCDGGDIRAQGEQEPPPELDGASCPCFTVSDIVTVAKRADLAGQCSNGNFFFDLAFLNSKETIDFFVACGNFDFGTDNCFCDSNNKQQSNLSLDEYTACVNVILNGLIQDLTIKRSGGAIIQYCSLGGG